MFPKPLRSLILCRFDVFHDLLVLPLIPNRTVVVLYRSVLLRLCRLDGISLPLGPYPECLADVFRAVAHTNCAGFPAPLSNAVQTADDTLCGHVTTQ